MWLTLLSLGLTALVGFLILAVLWSLHRREHSPSFPNDGLLRRELGKCESMFYMGAEKNCTLQLANAFFVVSKEMLCEDIFSKALTRLALRHPLLRCRVVKEDGVRPFFEELTNYKIPFTVSDFSDWKEEYEHQLMTKYQSDKEPLWRVALVQNHDNDFTEKDYPYQYIFVFGFRHDIIDGSSYVRLADEFLSELQSLHGETNVEANVGNDEIPSQTMPPALEEVMPKLSKLMATVEMFLNIALRFAIFRKLLLYLFSKIPRNPWILKFGAEKDRNPDAEKKTTIIPMTFTEEETRTLLVACKKHEVTVQAAVQVAVGVALADIVHNGGELPEKMSLKIPVTANARNMFPEYFKSHLCHIVPYMGAFNFETLVTRNWREEFWSLANNVHSHLHNRTAEESLKTYNIFRVIISIFIGGVDIMLVREKDHGRMDSHSVFTNLGNCNKLSQGTRIMKVAGRFGSSAEHIVGHIFANNLMTVNKRLFWTVTYYPHITSKETTLTYAKKVKETLLYILKTDDC